MLPPPLMLAIKKRGRVPLRGLLILLCLCGCAPPGPRALLKGERLIRQGKYEQAIQSLQEAARLLPRNAQAYNHLGLALHGARQFDPALTAYKRALTLDHKLAAAHYNLGCLYLEQNDAANAIEQLTSYTLLQPNSVDGWLKLGDAQLRARKLDVAEKIYKTVQTSQPRHPEMLNGLGIIQLQRKRPQDALNFFNVALVQNPNYSPALLNAGLVNQQYLNNRQGALEKYRQYLALAPRPPNWEIVSAMASRLDLELNPPPPRPLQSNVALAAKNNLTPPTNLPARATSNHPPPTMAASNPRTNNPTPPPAPAKTVAVTNQAATNPFVIANVKAPPAETPKPPPPAPLPIKPAEIEVTQVPDELVVKPPQDISIVRPPAFPASREAERPTTNASDPGPLLVNKTGSKQEKPTLLSRLNPFGGKPKPAVKEPSPSPSVETGPSATGSRASNDVLVAAPSVFPRYNYVSPSKPISGDRAAAEKFFTQGIKAQQAGRADQALVAYQKATQSDPAYFEAYYNQGLAAYGMRSWKESLLDYEYALVIKPSSVDARYNFALALQQASYPLDAADELLEILNERPSEARAHLLLANLYAGQLNQPKLARQHYLKVLEAEPHHPKAAEIRYWLAGNP